MAVSAHLRLLPLVIGVGLITTPALAFSGIGQVSDSSNNQDMTMIDGTYFNTYAQSSIYLGNGKYDYVCSTIVFNDPSYSYGNGVGYLYYVNSSGTRYYYGAYEIAGPGQGDTIYFNTAVPIPNDNSQISAGMWRSNGNTWHFNWWTPNANQGIDVSNNAGIEDIASQYLKVYSNGGCPNNFGSNTSWNNIWRSKSTSVGPSGSWYWQGAWYYFPSMSNSIIGSNSSPTWTISGNAGNGGNIYYNTTSCP